MGTDKEPQPDKEGGAGIGLDLGAFLIAFVFVWVVFDNLALGLLAGVIFGGGSRAARKRRKSD
ncbi:hypothetical protein HK107_15160 [Parvularcula sp. ZS-1/3]|uniref:Uncharacterized protein n=1 Tax=Parvularcula mediterranea TaxID=2732508 RepID=A0A7Y3RP32_9PROT|nr:hypothetical protein [Parvularcula mediterranea]NNU17669.1 hypothetical protein [Parvularcula mediterranea]